MIEIPNFWAHIDGDSTQAEIDAADRAHDEWLKSPDGQQFLEEDRQWVAQANAAIKYESSLRECSSVVERAVSLSCPARTLKQATNVQSWSAPRQGPCSSNPTTPTNF